MPLGPSSIISSISVSINISFNFLSFLPELDLKLGPLRNLTRYHIAYNFIVIIIKFLLR